MITTPGSGKQHDTISVEIQAYCLAYRELHTSLWAAASYRRLDAHDRAGPWSRLHGRGVELRWTRWLDDPLPRKPGKCSKQRLHDTIKDLNRRQTPHLIQFKGDGTGTRVGWEYR